MSWSLFERDTDPNSQSALGLDKNYIIPVTDTDSSEGFHYRRFQDHFVSDEVQEDPRNNPDLLWRHSRNKSNSTEISRTQTFQSISSTDKWARYYSLLVLFVLSAAFISFLLMTFKPRAQKHSIGPPLSSVNETHSPVKPWPFPLPRNGFFNHITSSSPSTSPSIQFILPSFTSRTPTMAPFKMQTHAPSPTPTVYPTSHPATSFPSKPPSPSPTQTPSQIPTTHFPSLLPTVSPTTHTPSLRPSMLWTTQIEKIHWTTQMDVATTPVGRCALPTSEYWSTNSQLFHARIHVLTLESFSAFSAEICWRISPTHAAFSCDLHFDEQGESCSFLASDCSEPDGGLTLLNITFSEEQHFEFTLIEETSPVADFSLFTEETSTPLCSFSDTSNN